MRWARKENRIGRVGYDGVDYPMHAGTVPQTVMASLKACGLDALVGNDKITLPDLNATLDAAHLGPGVRISLKRELVRAGKVTG